MLLVEQQTGIKNVHMIYYTVKKTEHDKSFAVVFLNTEYESSFQITPSWRVWEVLLQSKLNMLLQLSTFKRKFLCQLRLQ
jgi:hypothetical protein